jgi:hypothetical protein
MSYRAMMNSGLFRFAVLSLHAGTETDLFREPN